MQMNRPNSKIIYAAILLLNVISLIIMNNLDFNLHNPQLLYNYYIPKDFLYSVQTV